MLQKLKPILNNKTEFICKYLFNLFKELFQHHYIIRKIKNNLNIILKKSHYLDNMYKLIFTFKKSFLIRDNK